MNSLRRSPTKQILAIFTMGSLVLLGGCFVPLKYDGGAANEITAPSWPPTSTRTVMAIYKAVPDVHWDASGLLVISTGNGSTVRAFDPATGSEIPFDVKREPPHDQPRAVRPGLFAHQRPVLEVPAPDFRSFAGTYDGDVWLRSAGSDDRSRLTEGGQANLGFDIEGAKWSSDGKQLAVKKLDARGVPTIPLIRYSEASEPVTRIPYSRVGQVVPRAELFIVARDGGQPVRVEPGEMDAPYLNIVGWSDSGDSVYFMRMKRLMKRLEFRVADTRSGKSRLILAEESDTYIIGIPFLHGMDAQLDNDVRPAILLARDRFLWTSERDGWRRLYLYDSDGTLVRPLSADGFDVVSVDGVDEKGGWVYYTALIDRDRPYDETLVRVPLSGGVPENLVNGPFFHNVEFDQAFGHFWVRREGSDMPPILELYRSDGTLVRELWSGADMARESGWKPPEKFTAKAADGHTDLYGLVYTPTDFDASRKYPVVEYIYPGPFTTTVPKWMDPYKQAFADLGFILVVVDARSTPGRGRKFLDAFYGEFGQHEIADHAAVLRQLAKERHYMDLARVGVEGGSWGGYGVLRAMLLEPDLYKVGVATAPAVDLEHFRVSIEPYIGCFPADCPDVFELGSSTAISDQLKGKLLLMHGTSDDDVPFVETIRLITALTDAGKPYDLVVFPESNHGIGWQSHQKYWWERKTQYFLDNL